MKKFFKVTVLLTLLLLRFPAAAEEKPTVILNLEEKPQSRPVSLEETVTRFLDSAKYFEQKYPGELIDGDIHEDIARHHPEFTPQEVYDYQQYLRGGMKVLPLYLGADRQIQTSPDYAGRAAACCRRQRI